MKTIVDYTEEIKAYADYKAGTSLVQIPSVVGDTFTYDGTQQGPTITGLDTTKCTVTNATKINAGTYTLTIALNDTSKMMWDDLTTADKTYTYTINKANGAITLSKNSVSLDTSTPSDTVTFSGNTGAVTVSSSDDTIATASVSNNAITITAVDSGTATITVDVAGSDNYNSTSTSISVEATMKPALVSWSTGTDDEIAAMVNGYYNGDLTFAEIQSVWSVGSIRNISLSAMSATEVEESHKAQSVQVALLAFNVDELTTPINGITKALVSVGLHHSLSATDIYNDNGSTNTENGKMYNGSSRQRTINWTNCSRRTWCNSTFYNAIPQKIRNIIKSVNKRTSEGNGSSTIEISEDYCWLPSVVEVWGITDLPYGTASEGSQYSQYRTASYRGKIPKWNSSSVTGRYWYRSPNVSSGGAFWNCTNQLSKTTSYGYGTYGIAPHWCM